MGHPVNQMALEYFPTKEQATCLCLHRMQPFWNSHQSLGAPAHPSLGDVHVTQRHPPNGLIRAGEDERWSCGGGWDHSMRFCVSFWLHYKLTSPLTSQPSHRSVSIHPALAALPRGASPMHSLPSHLPIPLSFPVQATSAETHPLRCTNSFPAAGLSAEAIYPQELLIPKVLGPKAIRGRARGGSPPALWEQPRLPTTCKDAPRQMPLSSGQNYPSTP